MVARHARFGSRFAGGTVRPVLVVAIAAAALAATLGACRTSGRNGDVVVSPEVLEALRARGEAEVTVALELPPGDDSDRDARIARAQDQVLHALDPADFRLRIRFESVSALAGTVLTERGLRVLSEHPAVRRVDLDPDGGGSR